MENVNNIVRKEDIERLRNKMDECITTVTKTVTATNSLDYKPDMDKVSIATPITYTYGGGAGVCNTGTLMATKKSTVTLPIKKEPHTKIKDVKIIVENKVVEVLFADGDKQKSVCREPDVFSLETAISICITKHVLGGSNLYNKAVRNGLKYYENKLKKAEAEEKEKERIEKRKAKLAAHKKRRAEKRKEEQIETQKEAYLRAMRDFNKELSEASCK